MTLDEKLGQMAQGELNNLADEADIERLALGLVAGYRGGWTDRIVSIFTDTLLAFPSLILLIAIVTALNPTLPNVTFALGVMVVPSFARLVRANAMSYANREFVPAARSLGAGELRIMFREVAPNIVQSVFAYSFMLIAVLIVALLGGLMWIAFEALFNTASERARTSVDNIG